jgi:hypothetical protein
MQALKFEQVEDVEGGALAFGAALGAVGGGVSAWATGGDLGDIVIGATYGAIGGLFGGAGSMLWSAGSRLAGGMAGGTGVGVTSLPAIVRKN